jgi:DNA-binding transcriptional LysR family regulator
VQLSGVDLNLIVALDALLTERHVTRAAQRMSVGQPAMSASLARLRRHFGDPLLVRQGREMVPTAMAETLVEPVRQAVAAAGAVLGRSSGFEPERDTRTFTLVASDYVTMVLLRPLLAELRERAPGVRITVRQIDAAFAELLHRGQADMVILPTEMVGKGSEFPHEPLFTDRYVLVVDRDNDRVDNHASVEDLRALRFVGYGGGGLVSVTDRQLGELGLTFRADLTTQEFMVAPFLVAGTCYASWMLERLAVEVAERLGVRVVEHDVPLRPIHEAVYWHPRHANDPAHQWMRDQLAGFAARM